MGSKSKGVVMDEDKESIIEHIVKIREYIELLRENSIIDDFVAYRLHKDLDKIEAIATRK